MGLLGILKQGLKFYEGQLAARPIRTSMITTGSLMGFGDFIAQQIEFAFGVTSPGKNHYNYVRTARMTVFGAVGYGPLLHVWYRGLHRATCSLPRVPQTLVKVGLDQAVFAPVALAWYFGATGVLEGLNAEAIKDKVMSRWRTSWETCVVAWTPLQLFNFGVVPPVFQALFVNCANICWQTFLSYKNHKKIYVEEPDEEQQEAETDEPPSKVSVSAETGRPAS